MTICNIIFDIGNVLVPWNPNAVIAQVFPDSDQAKLTQDIFKSELWLDLNRGKFSENELVQKLHSALGIEISKLKEAMDTVREHLLNPIPGSHELLRKLHEANYKIYALTDNTHEFVAFLEEHYAFWKCFRGVVNSADLGVLKPNPQIYQHLLTKYQLKADECVFLDDLSKNIAGAQHAGMHGIVFETTAQAVRELGKLGVRVP